MFTLYSISSSNNIKWRASFGLLETWLALPTMYPERYENRFHCSAREVLPFQMYLLTGNEKFYLLVVYKHGWNGLTTRREKCLFADRANESTRKIMRQDHRQKKAKTFLQKNIWKRRLLFFRKKGQGAKRFLFEKKGGSDFFLNTFGAKFSLTKKL